MRRVLAGMLGVAVLVGLGAVPADAAKRRPILKARLTAFRSCTDLVAYGRRYATSTAVANGVPSRAVPTLAEPFTGPVPVPAPAAKGEAPAAATPTAGAELTAGDDAFSGTNNQEAAVDEADIAKSQGGKRLFAVVGGRLLAYDITGDTPALLGSVAVEGTPRELLLRGDRALVIGQAGAETPVDVVGGGPVATTVAPKVSTAVTRVTEVAIADPAKMTISRTLTVDGSYVTGRLTGGTARIVLNTPPEITTTDAPTPTPVPMPGAAAAAAGPGLTSFVPRTVLHSNITNRTFERPLVGCGQVYRPVRYSGLDLLTVLTVDLDKGLFNVDRDAVLAGAETVYASEGSLYVASRRYIPAFDSPADVPASMTTEIHRFDASQPDRTRYAASGSVPGFVLNQFALSEWQGDLRVATTEDPLWLSGAQQRDSESGVSVLRQDGGKLVQIGRAGGLGTGERIYAVRFLGDRGYVVTFRQVDPLYTLDLADPKRPRVAGELKIAGYSAYLHPVGDDLLLGVGQDATEQGMRAGAQVSLFDVSDPASPRRLQQRAFGSATSSDAEWDHLAFLWWGPTSLAMLPLQQYAGTPFTGAVGLRVRRTGIDEVGRVTHGDTPYPTVVRRSFVAGGRVITLSDRGIAANRLDTLSPLGFTAFPAG